MAPHFFGHHDSPSNLAESLYPRRAVHALDEGTGTLPDYLVNSVLTKNEGPNPKKIVKKSRNRCCVNSGGVGAHGQLTRSSRVILPVKSH